MTNMTADWLRSRGKDYLADAIMDGRLLGSTAFHSALDARPLSERLAKLNADLAKAKRIGE